MATDPHTDHFDWEDFMGDTLELSAEAVGAWLRCLFKMRKAPIRGRLSLTVSGFGKLFGKSPAKARAIIDELVSNGVADLSDEHFLFEETDLESGKNEKRNGRVTRRNVLSRESNAEDNAIVTLENRRMYRLWKKRNGNAIRQLRFRQKKNGSPRNAKVTRKVTRRNANVTFDENAKNGSSHIGPRVRARVREEFKDLNTEEEKRKPQHRVTPSRIPDPFPITPEMWAWLAENIPDLDDPVGRHHDWVEHWTNETGPKAEKLNWFLTWQKGMRLARKWQEEDRKNGTSIQNGTGNSTNTRAARAVQKHNVIEAAKSRIAERDRQRGVRGSDPGGSE